MNITGVILAAGTSSRLGSANKLLLKYKGHTVIEEVLDQLLNSAVDDILIVTGHDRAEIETLLAGRLTDRANLVYNSDFALGRAESIKCAIAHIGDRADAVLFMVADKPGVSTALIDRAIERYRQDRPAILYVETPAGRGHPIMFSKALFGDLLSLAGDCVGSDLIAGYKHDLIKLKDDTLQIDIDNEADYKALLKEETGERIL